MNLCSTCDGSGVVHRPDGEYLGECQCKKTGFISDEEPHLTYEEANAIWDSMVLSIDERVTKELIQAIKNNSEQII